MNIFNNHPDFCITTNELQFFAENNIEFMEFWTELCDDLQRKDGEKACKFGDLSKMKSNCQHVIGDVLINSGNEEFAWKLENMTNVYGSLTVKNTQELENVSFLRNIRQVANIKLDKIPAAGTVTQKPKEEEKIVVTTQTDLFIIEDEYYEYGEYWLAGSEEKETNTGGDGEEEEANGAEPGTGGDEEESGSSLTTASTETTTIKSSGSFCIEGVVIRFNPNLKDDTALWNWEPGNPTIFDIQYNPLLNITDFCYLALHLLNFDVNIYGNLRDCECDTVRIEPESARYYSNCSKIMGGTYTAALKIMRVNQSTDLSGLLKLEEISGSLVIYDTKIENISFLENVVSFTNKDRWNYSRMYNEIDISNNPKLKRLGLGSLKAVVPVESMNIKTSVKFTNNHRDFCMTTSELQVFAENDVDFYARNDAKLCNDLYRKDGEKVCYFEDLSTMDSGCQHIIGNVLIDARNEQFAWKLGNLTHIYGSFVMEGTQELTDVSFLSNLRQVVTLKFDLSEKQLTNAFKNMKHLIGSLVVNGSHFKSGKFLAGLETINCDNTGFFQWTSNDNLSEIGLLNLSTVSCRVQISSNPKLKNLNLSKMIPTPLETANYTRIDVEISNNSPDLCITFQEMSNMIHDENVDIEVMPEKFCEMPSSNSTMCNASLLDSGCSLVQGDLMIGASNEENVEKLRSVKSVFGSLTIEGTNLTSIDFLDSLEVIMTLNQSAILVRFNENLVNVSFPNLKAADFIIPPVTVAGCTFESSLVDSVTLKYFPRNCSTVCVPSALYIGRETDPTEKQLTEMFKNMKHLIGSLIVTQSKYKSGRFLAGLETVDCYNSGYFQWTLNENMTEIGMPNLTTVSCRVLIKSNVNMIQLNLPNLILVESSAVNSSLIDVRIFNNSPDFCISILEMTHFMTHDYIDLYQVHGTYCEDFENSTVTFEKKACDLTYALWEPVHSGCVVVLGDILILPENEDYVGSLESVETIFGSLILFNTTLNDTDFLGNLKHIISLSEDYPALIIENNEELLNVTIPKLQKVLSPTPVSIIVNNNSPTLMKNPSYCYGIRDKVTDSDTWIVKFDEKDCEDVEKAAATTMAPEKPSNGGGSINLIFVLAFVLCL
uniref:Recep_L_domain domain-containing protein n=1 Tax=Caenorhabditis tropicalis TaxID=1561998 RepID=A0A1I7V1T7_9PELO